MPTAKDIAKLHAILGKLKKKRSQPFIPPEPSDVLWMARKLENEWSEYIASFSTKNRQISQNDQIAQDDGFDSFWRAYPKPAGRIMPKGPAQEAWRKLKPDTALQAEILQAVEKQSTSWEWIKEDGKYVPYPKKWLAERRWEAAVGESLFDNQQSKPCVGCGYNQTLHTLKGNREAIKQHNLEAVIEKVCNQYSVSIKES